MTQQEQIDKLTAELTQAKNRHSWIMDHIANGDCHLALEVFEEQSLNELLILQGRLIRMDVGRCRTVPGPSSR